MRMARIQGPNPAVIGHLVTDDGTAGGVHDKPDVGFYARTLM